MSTVQTHIALVVFSMCVAVAICAQAVMADGHFPEDMEIAELVGSEPNANFGVTVTGLGDVNGNGFDDVAIAAAFANNATGKVFIYFGGEEFFDTNPDLVLSGQAADDQFGISVAGDMDLNGSGYADIAIGARLSDAGSDDGGAVFIYFGGPDISAEPSLVLADENSDDWFGNSIDAAGDVNGDGYDDLIVGAPFNTENGNGSGKAYLFFGGPNMNAQPDLELFGDSVNHAHFGWSVAGAGDVNGNGYSDVIVGARLHGSGPANGTGRAYIFHGRPTMDATPDLIIDGESSNDWFGESVAGAGDVNGDGYNDVLVGAHFATPNGVGSGRAYVYFGGPTMNDAADITFDGPEADAQLGNDVSGLGDINKNGYDDMIFGAHFAHAQTGANAGKAFVLFGGPDMQSNTADLMLTGESSDDQFGESVAAAGHVANGSRAFIIGAHHNSEGGLGAGKAYVARLESTIDIPGDVNDDGVVNVDDLLIVLNAWGDCPVCDDCAADINDDCTVNVDDLLVILNNWG